MVEIERWKGKETGELARWATMAKKKRNLLTIVASSRVLQVTSTSPRPL